MPNPPYPVANGNVTVAGRAYKEPIPGSKDPVPPTGALANMLAYIKANGKTQLDPSWNAIPSSGTLVQKQNLVTVYFANVEGTAGTNAPGLPPLPIDSAKNAVNGIASSISSVTDFLKLLADPNTWLRVAEVLLGVILLGVGVAKMSSAGARIVNATPIGRLT